MSITPSYTHTSDAHLARIKVGNSVYYLKDEDLRSVVEAFGTATAKDSADAVTSTGVALPTESAIYSFVTSQIGTLGKVVNLLSASDHTTVSGAAAGDMVVESDGKEWLYDGTEWREVGDEKIYALKTTEIAGLSLSSNITSSALSSAMGLGSLASKNSASGTLANYVTGITGADYTPAGSVTVTLDQTATAATVTTSDYTPAGSVTVTLNQTATAASLTTSNYTPTGTVSVTPSTATFYQVASVGTLPSVTETASSFATAGITAAIDGTDSEMLVFTTATTASALTGTGFDAGTLPSLSASATTFVTGISSASFTGTEAANMKVTGVSYDKATVSSASFSGTKLESTMVTGVSYDKASVVASQTTFSGSSSTITPTLTSSTQNVSVS